MGTSKTLMAYKHTQNSIHKTHNNKFPNNRKVQNYRNLFISCKLLANPELTTKILEITEQKQNKVLQLKNTTTSSYQNRVAKDMT